MYFFPFSLNLTVTPQMSRPGIRWDEGNLQENEEDALQANRMKIDEPKTPFHKLDEESEIEEDHQDRQLQVL